MSRSALILVLLGAAAVIPTLGRAAEWEPKLIDRWELELGAYFTGIDTEVRFDSSRGDFGTTIRFEDDLGFDDSEDIPRAALRYRLGRRHQLGVSWYDSDRTGRSELEGEIRWGDEVFPVAAEVQSFHDASFLDLSYEYWFYRRQEQTAVAAHFGLILFEIASGLEIASEGSIVTVGGDYETDAPVPQIGLNLRHALGRRFQLQAFGSYIAFEDIDDLDGDIFNLFLGVEHRTFKNAAFGLRFNAARWDIDSGDKRSLGKYKFDISGFQLYLRLGF